MKRLLAIVLAVASRSAARRRPLCRAARRDHGRSGQGSAGAGTVARTALHGLPEPVDRRFRGAAGARPAAAGARAHRGRRQRRAGDRFSGGALRRVRAAQAAASSRTRCCSGCCRRWCWSAADWRCGFMAARRARSACSRQDCGALRLTADEEARLEQLIAVGAGVRTTAASGSRCMRKLITPCDKLPH